MSEAAENLNELLEADLPDENGQIARLLESEGRLMAQDYVRAGRLAAESGVSVWNMLLKLGLVAEKDLARAFSEVLGLQQVDGDELPEVALFEESVSQRFLKDSRVLPLYLEEERLYLAMADPTDRFAIDAMQAATGHEVVPVVGLPSEIDNAIEKLYGAGRSAMGEIVEGLEEGGEGEADVETLKDLASEAPVIRLVNLIIQRAVESRASDIHVEPFEEQLKVRYRVDGVLTEVEAPPSSSTAAVISRIKLMAKLNIAERRLPQDGRISLRVQGKELDLRVSTVPTLFGESVVIRLLDKESVKFDFGFLGFDGEPLERFKHILEMPHGIVLVTGPTGSGKSTTLYTALSRLNTAEKKIITVEDPVEYQIAGINQIQVKPQIDLTFASALRSIVRQDPDIIMVGEMRDLETARIAVQSALTGHLVLSTLHTNDAAGGVTRLLDMGVEDYLITSTINGIVAQRLVRRLCDRCAEAYEPLPELVEELELQEFAGEDGRVRLHRAVGCEACGGSGYHGRLALTEVLVMNDDIRRLVMQHANAGEIQQAAIADGMATLHRDGLRKAAVGLTTLEEVARVAEE
ncbi:MAG: type II secretion system protein GspE [Gammaproteobacteria bacterium]|nr:MAG: type II secretion system protein GspE [Gammaproteobacteria bacterium]RTZ73309.1 MAG: type II secretion system protein GspE [Gammaproteobacteria bacterium]